MICCGKPSLQENKQLTIQHYSVKRKPSLDQSHQGIVNSIVGPQSTAPRRNYWCILVKIERILRFLVPSRWMFCLWIWNNIVLQDFLLQPIWLTSFTLPINKIPITYGVFSLISVITLDTDLYTTTKKIFPSYFKSLELTFKCTNKIDGQDTFPLYTVKRSFPGNL